MADAGGARIRGIASEMVGAGDARITYIQGKRYGGRRGYEDQRQGQASEMVDEGMRECTQPTSTG